MTPKRLTTKHRSYYDKMYGKVLHDLRKEQRRLKSELNEAYRMNNRQAKTIEGFLKREGKR